MRGGRFKPFLDATAGSLTIGLLNAIKHTDRKRMANVAGAFMRKIGPLFKEHRLGRTQLRAAFPEKSDVEIEKILGGVWDNLGRIAIEFAHLDEFCVEGFGRQTSDVITYPPESEERYDWIMHSGRATNGFAAHLANWELPGIGASPKTSSSVELPTITLSVPIPGPMSRVQEVREATHGALTQGRRTRLGRYFRRSRTMSFAAVA